jgi:hypothetical protein
MLEENADILNYHCVKCGEEYDKEIFCMLSSVVGYYNRQKRGYDVYDYAVERKLLKKLRALNLVFKTKKGWFPSTKGQEVIKLYVGQ